MNDDKITIRIWISVNGSKREGTVKMDRADWNNELNEDVRKELMFGAVMDSGMYEWGYEEC